MLAYLLTNYTFVYSDKLSSMATKKNTFALLSALVIVYSLLSCSSKKKDRFSDSQMYDFTKPAIIKLPEALDEISGIVYYPKDTSVFAIVDEEGMLYKIPIKNPEAVQEWRYDKRRDYEDIVLVDSTFYVLVSNGDIETIRFKGSSIFTEKSDYTTHSKKANEFESMYYNNDIDGLVIVCKECEDDSKKTLSSFSYGIHDSLKAYQPYQVMDVNPIAEKLGLDKIKLKPSAVAINPVSEDLYILSSIEKVIVIASKKGRVKEVYKLDPSIYKQPEGMTFTPQGDLIISNEYAETGFAELLLMKNKLKGR